MPENYNGYTLNIAGDAPPWGARENTLFKAMLDFLPNSGEVNIDGHHHYNLYSDDEATATAVVYVDDNGGDPRVGVNVVAPIARLHLREGASGIVALPFTYDEGMFIEGNGGAELTLGVAAGGNCRLIMGDVANADEFIMTYAHATNRLSLEAATAGVNIYSGNGCGWGLGGFAAFACGLYLANTAGGAADTSSILLDETTGALLNPGANQCIIYCIDNGAGKTVLRARFQTGAAQVLATEP